MLWLPLHRFPWNFMFGICSQICRRNSVLVKTTWRRT